MSDELSHQGFSRVFAQVHLSSSSCQGNHSSPKRLAIKLGTKQLVFFKLGLGKHSEVKYEDNIDGKSVGHEYELYVSPELYSCLNSTVVVPPSVYYLLTARLYRKNLICSQKFGGRAQSQ